jgi:hypothetical protein
VDNAKGIVRVIAPEGREEELEGLLTALHNEIGMVELHDTTPYIPETDPL